MSAKVILGSMLAGAALVSFLGATFLGPRDDEPPPVAPPPPRVEVPWLSKDAAALIVDSDGAPGPLFVDVRFGLPVTPEAHARISEFAKTNNVEIALDMVEGTLAAIRFSVTYGGCCGYEGADVFAGRIGRPDTGTCCVCGPQTYINDWTTVTENGIHMRGRVRINRVALRWEKTATLADLIERADSLLGASRDVLARGAGDLWYEIEPNRRYLLEMPFPVPSSNDYAFAPRFEDRPDVGMLLTAHAGVITEVELMLREPYRSDETSELPKLLKARWGRPKVGEYEWTWRTRDRAVTAWVDSSSAKITISRGSRAH